MSDTLNINHTITVPYRTDILADVGIGKYYIKSASVNTVFECNNYDIGDAQQQRNPSIVTNPVIVDELMMYGDFYYNELKFKVPTITGADFLRMTDYGDSFAVIDRIYIDTSPYRRTKPRVYLRMDGMQYEYSEWNSVKGEILAEVELPWSFDLPGNLFFHLSYDNTRHGYESETRPYYYYPPLVGERLYWTWSEISAIDTHQEYYNAITTNIKHGFACLSTHFKYYFPCSWDGEIRIGYVASNGNIISDRIDVTYSPFCYYRGTNKTLNLYVPFANREEVCTAICANSQFEHTAYDWYGDDINRIRGWINGDIP